MPTPGWLYRGEFPVPVSIRWAEPPDSDRDRVVIKSREGHHLKLQLRSLGLLGHICSPCGVLSATRSQRAYADHGLKIGVPVGVGLDVRPAVPVTGSPAGPFSDSPSQRSSRGEICRRPIALRLLESLCYFSASEAPQ